MRHIKTKLLCSKFLWSSTVPGSMFSKQYIFLVSSSCCLSLINANFVPPIKFFHPFIHSFINFFTPLLLLFYSSISSFIPPPLSFSFHFFQVPVFSPLLLHQPLSIFRKSFYIKISFFSGHCPGWGFSQLDTSLLREYLHWIAYRQICGATSWLDHVEGSSSLCVVPPCWWPWVV